MKEKLINNRKILGIIFVLTILLSFPYLNKQNITAHDISYHTNRIISISEELKAGHFPVLIHSNLLNGFGYANSLFYPELFLYIPAILTALGINFLTSYKIFLSIITFFTLLFTYVSANRIFKNRNTSLLITILYGTALYRLTDIYARGALGEVLALCFLPLVLCGLYEIIFENNKNWWIVCFGIFGIINSHVLSFAMTAVLIFVIVLVNCKRIFKDKKRLTTLIIAGIISCFLSLSFILPYLEQIRSDTFNVDKVQYGDEFLGGHAVTLKELIINKFDNGNFYKGMGTILIILPLLIFQVKKKDNQTKFMKQLVFIGFFILFMTTSLFPWTKACKILPFLKVFQFPYRLNVILIPLLSFSGGYALCEALKNREELIILVSIFLVLFTLQLLSTFNTNFGNFDEQKIINLAPVGNGEYKPFGLKETDYFVHNVSNLDKIDFVRKSSKLEFFYANEKDKMQIHIPLTYYKGYKAYITDANGNKTKLRVSEDKVSKNIIISNDKILNGKITVEYKMTLIQLFSYSLTFITIILLTIYISITSYKKETILLTEKTFSFKKEVKV